MCNFAIWPYFGLKLNCACLVFAFKKSKEKEKGDLHLASIMRLSFLSISEPRMHQF